MDIAMNLLDDAISFVKDTVNGFMETWDKLDEDKKKLLIGCIAAAAALIAVASIAYKLGKAHGQNELLEDEDF